MKYNADNVFAKILRGEIPCKKIYEDDFALAFYDINPKAKVHALVITKSMVVDYTDFMNHADDVEVAGFMRAIAKVAEMIGVEADGYRVVFNKGPHSGQEVPHLHAHILGGEQLKCDL